MRLIACKTADIKNSKYKKKGKFRQICRSWWEWNHLSSTSLKSHLQQLQRNYKRPLPRFRRQNFLFYHSSDKHVEGISGKGV